MVRWLLPTRSAQIRIIGVIRGPLSQADGHDRRNSPPGEGPALLQGLAVCGLCGQRMTLRYHTRGDRQVPTYVCQRAGIEQAAPICQSIPGQTLDETISQLLQELMTPLTLDVALAVQQELEQRLVEVDRLRRQHVERLKYAADIARQRSMQVDPGNRLVADTLEADWNQALRDLATAQEDYEQQSASDRSRVDEDVRQKVRALASDFPRIWNDPDTPDQQRKRMVRLLIEDVTLVKGSSIQAQVRFRGGATRTLAIDKPRNAGEIRKTKPQIIEEIDRLLNEYTAGQIATILNDEGRTSGEGRSFTARIIQRLCHDYDITSRYDRLRERGLLTADELAAALQVSQHTIGIWRREGLLQGYPYTDKPECLYDPPDAHSPRRSQGKNFSERRRFPLLTPQRPNEVQHAT